MSKDAMITESFKTGLAVIFAAGAAYASIATIPKITERINAHDVELAEVRTDIKYIKEGITRIEKKIK